MGGVLGRVGLGGGGGGDSKMTNYMHLLQGKKALDRGTRSNCSRHHLNSRCAQGLSTYMYIDNMYDRVSPHACYGWFIITFSPRLITTALEGVFVKTGRDGPPRAARTQITLCYVMPCCVILNEPVDACSLRAVGSYFRVERQVYE